jgi:hypothetical protein
LGKPRKWNEEQEKRMKRGNGMKGYNGEKGKRHKNEGE